MQWLTFALLSALFAASTSILAKIGVKDINSNLATAVRTVVITIFAWSIVFFHKDFNGLNSISKHSLLFLILSGLTTGISWLFYFRALQLGSVSKVVPIDKLSLVLVVLFGALFLSEKVTFHVVLGSILMIVGAILVAF
ncbi:EamA family transporter [Patescibacteria group bacterium]|nr:EamA family transporter [Patescibacteria group bacterium]